MGQREHKETHREEHTANAIRELIENEKADCMVLTRIHNFFLNQNRKRERFLSLPSFLLERRESMATGATTTLEGLSLEDEQQIIFSNTFTKELLDAFYNNNDKEQQLYALRMIRKLLSRARGAPIQQVGGFVVCCCCCF